MAASILKLTGFRGMIGKKMRASLETHAQLTYTTTVDATALLAARQKLKEQGSIAGIEDLLIKTVATTLQDHPEHNGWVEGQAAHLAEPVHMGIAIATPGALMVPVIRDVCDKSLEDVAQSRKELVSRAMQGKLNVKDMTGGTFTISNLGQTRVEHFTPILNTPQIAILGVGRMVDRPRISEDGKLELRKDLGLSLTADHAVVDGWPSGKFLSGLAANIESLAI